MPFRSPQPCWKGGCSGVGPRGACERHPRAQSDTSPKHDSRKTTERGYGWSWQLLRAKILERDPVCRACGLSPSTEVDHIVPKSRGGTDEHWNLRGICGPCHAEKSGREGGGGRFYRRNVEPVARVETIDGRTVLRRGVVGITWPG